MSSQLVTNHTNSKLVTESKTRCETKNLPNIGFQIFSVISATDVFENLLLCPFNWYQKCFTFDAYPHMEYKNSRTNSSTI